MRLCIPPGRQNGFVPTTIVSCARIPSTPVVFCASPLLSRVCTTHVPTQKNQTTEHGATHQGAGHGATTRQTDGARGGRHRARLLHDANHKAQHDTLLYYNWAKHGTGENNRAQSNAKKHETSVAAKQDATERQPASKVGRVVHTTGAYTTHDDTTRHNTTGCETRMGWGTTKERKRQSASRLRTTAHEATHEIRNTTTGHNTKWHDGSTERKHTTTPYRSQPSPGHGIRQQHRAQHAHPVQWPTFWEGRGARLANTA